MPESASVPSGRLPLATDVLLAALPLLATVALYLPGGILMPFRWVVLALVAAAAVVIVVDRRLAGTRVLTAMAVLASSFVLFGLIGLLRYRAQTSATDFLNAIILILLSLAAAVLARRERSIVLLVAGWVASGVVAAPVAVWEILTNQHLPKNLPGLAIAQSMPWVDQVASFFDNPNLYAYHCGIVILLLPVAFQAAPRFVRWVIPALGLLLLYLLVQTGGRLALVGVLLGLLVWGLAARTGRILTAVGIIAFVVGVLAKVPLVEGFLGEGAYALSEFSLAGSSSWVRLELLRSGGWILQQTSFMGAGPGGFGTWSLLPQDPYRYETLNNPHSGLVEVGADYGVVTLAVLLALLITAIVIGIRWSRDRTWTPLERSIPYAAAVQALTWPLLTASHSTWLRQPIAAAQFATIVALLAYAEYRRRRQPAAERPTAGARDGVPESTPEEGPVG